MQHGVRRVRLRTKRKAFTPEMYTWARFTPSETTSTCQARTWSGGRGGQCGYKKHASNFCCQHAAGQAWKTHGRVDGAISVKKLIHFLIASRTDKASPVGTYILVKGDGWGSGSGERRALIVEARSSSLRVAPVLSQSELGPESLVLPRHCTFITKPAGKVAHGTAKRWRGKSQAQRGRPTTKMAQEIAADAESASVDGTPSPTRHNEPLVDAGTPPRVGTSLVDQGTPPMTAEARERMTAAAKDAAWWSAIAEGDDVGGFSAPQRRARCAGGNVEQPIKRLRKAAECHLIH